MPYWKVSSRVKKFRSGSRVPYYIYTLTSLTSVQEKVKVHSFRKYAPRAGTIGSGRAASMSFWALARS